MQPEISVLEIVHLTIMTITYYEPIDAYAGDPTSICGTDNPVLIDDAVILVVENSYESIEWRVINGFGSDPENNTTLKPTYQPHPLDATLLIDKFELDFYNTKAI